LGAFPVSDDLIGILGSLPDDANPDGILAGLADEANPQGILAGLADDPNVNGILEGLPAEANVNGLLEGLPEEKRYTAGKGAKQQLNYYSDLKSNPNETPQQYMKSAPKGNQASGHYVAQTKARKQSLLMLRQMSLRQMQRARVTALRRLQTLKMEGEEVACGVVACNPDKGCASKAFASCLAEVRQTPAKEKELLDMHRAEVLKLAREHKDVLAVKQLSAQQCVVESCSAEGCNNDRFKGCIKQHVARAKKATLELRVLHNKRALVLRKLLAQRRAEYLKLSPEQRKAYLKALHAKRAKALAAIKAKGKAVPQANGKQKADPVPKIADVKVEVKKAPTKSKQADAKKADAKGKSATKPPVHKADAKKTEQTKRADTTQKPVAKATAPKAADAKQTVSAPVKASAKKTAAKKAHAKQGKTQGKKMKTLENGSNKLFELITGSH